MTTTFAASTPLEQHVRNGDREAVLALLQGMDGAQRRAQRDSVRRLAKLIQAARWGSAKDGHAGWGMPPSPAQARAAGAALVLCGTAEDVAAELMIDDADLVALGRDFSPPSITGLADAMLRASPYRIRTVQALIAAGLVPRPGSDDYALGLIALPALCGPRLSMEDFFAQDRGLKAALLRMFDIEGTGDVSLASVEKYQGKKGRSWTQMLLALCEEGAFSRATLLDKTLSALERDWPQFRAGWFSRFHDQLGATVDEMRPHAARYLHLLGSRIPPTVSMALGVVSQLAQAGVVEPAALIDALAPVWPAGSKAQVEAALKLCDSAIRSDSAVRGAAALLACAALIHEAPELQKKVLQRLQAWGVDASVRAELQRHLPTLAASNRTLAGELAGAAPEAQAGAAPEASPPPAAVQLLDASRELQPIASAEELVACIAHVFEHDTELDEFERAVEALVRLAPLPPATVAALAPVVKRARKLRTPVAKELARLLLFVARGELSSVQAPVDHAGNESPVHAVLAARMDALAALAGQGCAVSPLSAPTHQRGFIAPAVLVERVRAHERAGACSAHEDQVLALLRLAPAATQEDRARARGLRDSPFARALRYALGDDLPPGSEVALFAAAARIRHPGRDDPAWPLGADALGPDAAVAARYAWAVTTRSWTVDGATYHHHDLAVQVMPERPGDCALLAVSRHPPPLPPGHNFYRGWSFGGIDEALVRHAATLLPSDLAAFFAEGARAIGGNLDWWEAQWQNKAYLEPLLDPTVEPGPMGTLLLCVALAGKEPGQTALAVDAFVAMSRQQRLDLPLLADTLRRLLATPLLKPPRLRKSLDAALRLAPALSRAVIELVLAALPVPPDEAPKDAAALLELLHELLVAAGRCLPEDRRAGIAAMALGGKGRSLQKALLALGAAPV